MAWERIYIRGFIVCALATSIGVAFGEATYAERFTSPNYQIDASVAGNSFGGQGNSSNYKLVSSGGESIIGAGTGGSYKIAGGYVAQLTGAGVAPSIKVNIQPANQVGNYPLDENTGTTTSDQSSYGASASLINSPTWTTGKLGNALTFNGSTQAVNAGNLSQYQFSSGTVEAWVRTSTTGATMAAVTKANAFWLGSDFGKFAVYDWTTNSLCGTSTTVLSGNTWRHIAFTYDSGVTNGSHIYLDGVKQKDCTFTINAQTGALVIGATVSGASYNQYFNGTIDHVRLFNRKLTSAEIAAEYAAQNTGNESGLSLNTIIAGTSQTAGFDVVTTTNQTSYSLAVNQNYNLTNGSNTIPSVGSSIASPAAWSEGTTKGLGFTVVSAAGLPGAWGAGSNYAALPGSATSFYTRNGYTPGVRDVVGMRLRADVISTQVSGSYSNTMTITGTSIP